MTIGDHELDAIRSADERSVIASRPPLLSLRIDFLAENLSFCNANFYAIARESGGKERNERRSIAARIEKGREEVRCS